MTTGSAEPVLLDTSVWIDYFHAKNPVYNQVENLIDEERVCIIELIAAEILQGTRSETEFTTLKEIIEVFPVLEEKRNTWITAAKLSGQIRRAGNPAGLADCYIAVMAHEHRVSLWSLDKHFTSIRNHLEFKLYRLR